MEAYIIDAIRTPVGRRGGGLSQVHPADLGAHTLTALFDRVDVDPAAVEDVCHAYEWVARHAARFGNAAIAQERARLLYLRGN